jgi:DNA-binding NtrC family response regulator
MQRACLLAVGRDRIIAADLMLDDDPDAVPVAPFVEHLVGLPLHQVERLLIEATLRATGGNQTRAAAVLGCVTRTLRAKLADYRAGAVPITAPRSLVDLDRLGASARRGC